MRHFSLSMLSATLLSLTLCLTPGSRAFGEHNYREPDVDIESLHGRLYQADGSWLLEVSYEIEVEDYHGGEPLHLSITPLERGQALLSPDGTPIEYYIPLNRPTDVDRDELEFKGGFSEYIGYDAIYDPGHVRLQAAVVHQASDVALDYKDKRVKYKGGIRSTYAPAVGIRPTTTIIYESKRYTGYGRGSLRCETRGRRSFGKHHGGQRYGPARPYGPIDRRIKSNYHRRGGQHRGMRINNHVAGAYGSSIYRYGGR